MSTLSVVSVDLHWELWLRFCAKIAWTLDSPKETINMLEKEEEIIFRMVVTNAQGKSTDYVDERFWHNTVNGGIRNLVSKEVLGTSHKSEMF